MCPIIKDKIDGLYNNYHRIRMCLNEDSQVFSQTTWHFYKALKKCFDVKHNRNFSSYTLLIKLIILINSYIS
jgi:hypothetical protein